MNADGTYKEEKKVMFHFKPLMENLVLIYNNWQQLKWDMVKSKKKNSKKKVAKTHGQAIRTQNVIWKTYYIFFLNIKCQ